LLKFLIVRAYWNLRFETRISAATGFSSAFAQS